MKVFVFLLCIAAAVAFPSGENAAEPHSELQPEMKKEELQALLAVEGNPKGDNKETDAERDKRFIFIGWPAVYAYPAVVRSKVIVI